MEFIRRWWWAAVPLLVLVWIWWWALDVPLSYGHDKIEAAEVLSLRQAVGDLPMAALVTPGVYHFEMRGRRFKVVTTAE